MSSQLEIEIFSWKRWWSTQISDKGNWARVMLRFHSFSSYNRHLESSQIILDLLALNLYSPWLLYYFVFLPSSKIYRANIYYEMVLWEFYLYLPVEELVASAAIIGPSIYSEIIPPSIYSEIWWKMWRYKESRKRVRPSVEMNEGIGRSEEESLKVENNQIDENRKEPNR